MKNAERYFVSTKILMDGVDNETLFYNNWGGCIDAHLIAGNIGYTFFPVMDGRRVAGMIWRDAGKSTVGTVRDWGKLLEAANYFQRRKLHKELGSKRYRWACRCLAATGYTNRQLIEIMELFDACYDGENDYRNIVAGLKVVLAKLKQIHEVTPRDQKVLYKTAFELEQEYVEEMPDEIYPSLVRLQEDDHFDYPSYLVQKQTRVQNTVLDTGFSELVAAHYSY